MKILLKCCTNGNFGDDLFVISISDRYASENHGFDILVYEKEKYTFLEKNIQILILLNIQFQVYFIEVLQYFKIKFVNLTE